MDSLWDNLAAGNGRRVGSLRTEVGMSGVSRVNISAVAIIHRHPDWWHSWHRDFMLIGIAVLIAGTLLGFLAVKKADGSGGL